MLCWAINFWDGIRLPELPAVICDSTAHASKHWPLKTLVDKNKTSAPNCKIRLHPSKNQYPAKTIIVLPKTTAKALVKLSFYCKVKSDYSDWPWKGPFLNGVKARRSQSSRLNQHRYWFLPTVRLRPAKRLTTPTPIEPRVMDNGRHAMLDTWLNCLCRNASSRSHPKVSSTCKPEPISTDLSKK